MIWLQNKTLYSLFSIILYHVMICSGFPHSHISMFITFHVFMSGFVCRPAYHAPHLLCNPNLCVLLFDFFFFTVANLKTWQKGRLFVMHVTSCMHKAHRRQTTISVFALNSSYLSFRLRFLSPNVRDLTSPPCFFLHVPALWQTLMLLVQRLLCGCY